MRGLHLDDIAAPVCVEEEDRLTSTVFVSWSGTDPDGLVSAFDIRYYDEGETRGPEEGWTRTTRRDSLVLLPIPLGVDRANVVFEVRAVASRQPASGSANRKMLAVPARSYS